jgi:hypothetical protein
MPPLSGADDVQWGESFTTHPCYSWWSWQFDTLWAPLIRLWPHSSLYYLQKCCSGVCSANLLIMYDLGTLNFWNHSSWCLFKQRYSETGTCIWVNVRACSKLGLPVPMRTMQNSTVSSVSSSPDCDQKQNRYSNGYRTRFWGRTSLES